MQLFHFEYNGKSARVSLAPLPAAKPKRPVQQRTAVGIISRARILNGQNPNIDPFKLTSQEMIAGDPEIDLASAGHRLETELTTVYFDAAEATPKPVGDFKEIDVIYDANGVEKERRPHVIRGVNLDTLHPIKIGKRLSIADALTSFVIRHSYQLVHEDGLTYDFLHTIAKDLHEKQEVAVLGAGAKGNLPLVIRTGGNPFRAFLFGEIGAPPATDKYRLLVLLSDQELKVPSVSKPG